MLDHYYYDRLSCGTTWHAAGLLGGSRGTRAHSKLAMYSNELYAKLEEETGLGTGESMVRQTTQLRYCVTSHQTCIDDCQEC